MPRGRRVPFALNHIAQPQLELREFFALARTLDIEQVEIRNDIAGQAILDGTAPETVSGLASDAGVRILTINALQRFDDWSDERSREAVDLIGFARDCGAVALILVPCNDGTGTSGEPEQSRLDRALRALQPMLAEAGIVGLVEPLGFETCSLRSKRQAVDAIVEVGGERTFRLTHDTFHHHLAGEPALFPEFTGLVHISGVVDPLLAISEMRDAHRLLVDERDRIGNVAQIGALLRAGYAGPVSFEPFAPELRQLPDAARAIRKSMDFIEAELAAVVA
jgi:2-keto-myo-inositol isomerase